jgi:hypothetical protein
MNFKTNFSKEVLFLNSDIEVIFEETKKIKIKTISFKDYYSNLDLQNFVSLLNLDVKTFNELQTVEVLKVETLYDVATSILLSNFNKDLFIESLEKFFLGLEVIGNRIEFKGMNLEVTSEEYELLISMFLISLGIKNYKDYEVLILKSKETEDEKRLREKLEKTKKIKKESPKESSKIPTIDQIVASILYHFKALSLEDIYNMNIYSVFRYYELAIGAQGYEAKLAALPTGAVKDFKYFI